MNPKLLLRLQKLEPNEANGPERVFVIKVREGHEDEDSAVLCRELAEIGQPVRPQDLLVQIRIINWPRDGTVLPESCRGIISNGNGWGKAA
jgi:hypothetical protein